MRPPPYGKRVRGGRSFPQSRKKEDSRYMIVNLIIGSLMIGSVYGMLALGYSLIYSASGLMTFTQGQLLMLGAFLGLQFYKNMGMPLHSGIFADRGDHVPPGAGSGEIPDPAPVEQGCYVHLHRALHHRRLHYPAQSGSGDLGQPDPADAVHLLYHHCGDLRRPCAAGVHSGDGGGLCSHDPATLVYD